MARATAVFHSQNLGTHGLPDKFYRYDIIESLHRVLGSDSRIV